MYVRQWPDRLGGSCCLLLSSFASAAAASSLPLTEARERRCRHHLPKPKGRSRMSSSPGGRMRSPRARKGLVEGGAHDRGGRGVREQKGERRWVLGARDVGVGRNGGGSTGGVWNSVVDGSWTSNKRSDSSWKPSNRLTWLNEGVEFMVQIIAESPQAERGSTGLATATSRSSRHGLVLGRG